MMLQIVNFPQAEALWPDRIALEITDADRCQLICYAALANMTKSMAAGLRVIDSQP